MRAFAASLPRHAFFLAVLGYCLTAGGSEIGFSRIVRGWTNYSTAFNTTHDSSAGGEFATVGTFYTPPCNVRPTEFASIVIWSESPTKTVDFSDFSFSVCFWTGLNAFIGNPRVGDLASIAFVQPTAIRQDTVTRGGRPAYELRFALTNASVLLTNCHTHVIGLVARSDASRSGQLYVPTAVSEGFSDVQAGSIVPFGWQYLIDAGGFTIYQGQVATELVVEPLGVRPTLFVARTNVEVRLSWPAAASCYSLEATEALGFGWSTVTNEPEITIDWRYVTLPSTNASRFFRLAR